LSISTSISISTGTLRWQTGSEASHEQDELPSDFERVLTGSVHSRSGKEGFITKKGAEALPVDFMLEKNFYDW